MKKSVLIITTLAIILGLLSGLLLFKPQKARAFVFGDILVALKEFALDILPKTVARHMMVRLQQEIARWAQGGFSDENKPFAMTDWKDELKDIANVAGATFVNEFNLAPLCAPIKVSLGTALGLNMPYGMVPYGVYAACTLQDVVNNVEAFYKNPSIGVYGWDSWTALTQSQNNIFGSILMALKRKEEITNEETQAKEKEIQAGGGIKNETICNATDEESCKASCESIISGGTDPQCQANCDTDYDSCVNSSNKLLNQCSGDRVFCIANCPTIDPQAAKDKCLKSCEKSSTGVCLQKTTKKLGSEIKASVDKAIGSDIDWLISADEITEMINLVFSGLFNKLVNGANGLLTKAFYKPTDTVAKNQLEYGYYQQYKKSLTPQDRTRLRSEILTNILKTVKSITTSTYDCNKDNQVTGDVFSEAAADIIEEESQHLYTTMEGVDLKPDYEVLDTSLAVNNHIAIYGVTHDDIPTNKYPDKCAEIAGKNKKCIDIKTNLPYELIPENINPAECVATGCHAKINEYRAAGDTDNDAINKAVADGKCSSFAIGNECLQGGYLIDNTKNKCSECMKRAQETCELKETAEEKIQCIETYCGNYKDISSSIRSAQDFYNRCSQSEIKNSCEVCLMEYFMPAEYCNEINDFVYRAFVKYPALVYSHTWYGIWTKIGDGGGDCSPNTDAYLPTALICRIVPDFTFWGTGTCKTFCPNTTDDELKDISDDKPSELDCTGPNVNSEHPGWGGVFYAGGGHPTGLYVSWLTTKRTKCCAAFTGHMPEEYERCRGISGSAREEPPPEIPFCYGKSLTEYPECYCYTGWTPLGGAGTGWTNADRGSLRGDCMNFFFTYNGRELYGETNTAAGGDTVFVGTGTCSETDETTDNACRTSIGYTGELDVSPPSGVIWQEESIGGQTVFEPDPSKPEEGGWCEGNGEYSEWDIPISGLTVGTRYFGGVYHDSLDDGSTSLIVCEKCDDESQCQKVNYVTGKPETRIK